MNEKPTQPVYIYALVDPRNPALIRYIGQTRSRLSRHLQHCSESGQSHKCQWIEALRDEGIMPQMIILETADSANADVQEAIWIADKRHAGLTNLHCGIRMDTATTATLEPAWKAEARQADIVRVTEALLATKHNITATAKMLGCSRPTVYEKLRLYNL